jgi:hypothetical protein
VALRIEQWQLIPIDAVHQHAASRAQIPRHHIHGAHMTAMRIEQDQLVDACGL